MPPAVTRVARAQAAIAHSGLNRCVALSLMLLCGLAGRAEGDTLRVAWDSSGSEISSYVVHVGPTDGVYEQRFDVGLARTFAFTAAVPGQRYCFAVTALANGVSSQFSNEVCGYSNMYPTLTAPAPQRGVVGDTVAVLVQGGDPLGDSVTYSASNLPAGLEMDGRTGLIAGRFLSAGAFIVTVTVSDGILTTSASFRWTVTPPGATEPVASEGQPAGDPPSASPSPGSQPSAGQPSAGQPSTGPPSTGPPSTGQPSTGQPQAGQPSNPASPLGRATAHSSPGAAYTGRVAIPRRANSTGQAGGTGRTTRSTAKAPAPARRAVASGAATPSGTTATAMLRPSSRNASAAPACGAAESPCIAAEAAAPVDDSSRIADVLPGTATPPAVARVSILTPVSQALFPADALILFMADAEDALAQAAGARVVWSSSRDGRLGAGATLLKSLTSGTHTITAAITLDDGSVVRSSVTIVVGAARKRLADTVRR